MGPKHSFIYVPMNAVSFRCAWSVAYAYASRHLSAYLLSSSPEARALVSRLVPFLVARDDKTCFPGIESASTDIYSRFDAVCIVAPFCLRKVGTLTGSFSSRKGAITPAAFALLLRDAATFLRPPPLVSEDGDQFVPGEIGRAHV